MRVRGTRARGGHLSSLCFHFGCTRDHVTVLRMEDIAKYITSSPRVAHGNPVFKGTRIMVYLVLEMLAGGESVEDILRAYPKLTKRHVNAAFGFASHSPEMRGSIVRFDHALSR